MQICHVSISPRLSHLILWLGALEGSQNRQSAAILGLINRDIWCAASEFAPHNMMTVRK